MNRLHLAMVLATAGSVLMSQETGTPPERQMGFQMTRHARTFQNVTVQSSILAVGFEHRTSAGSRFSLYIGGNDLVIPSSEPSVSGLTSTPSIFYRVRFFQEYRKFYLRVGVLHYRARGRATVSEAGPVSYVYDNEYSILEYPAGAGYTFDLKILTASVGLMKSYFYGINKKELLLNDGNRRIALGEMSSSFIAQLPIGYEFTLKVDLPRNLNLRLSHTLFGEGGSTTEISLWGPLAQAFGT